MKSKRKFPEEKSSLAMCHHKNQTVFPLQFLTWGAPSYKDAVAACDKYAKNWRTSGGVPSSSVGPIINLFTSVTTTTTKEIKYTGDVELNECVLLINQGGNIDHAVNAIKYVHSKKKFHYNDHGKNATGTVLVSEVTAFYPFNQI